jgi:predicted nucleotidyltransferase
VIANALNHVLGTTAKVDLLRILIKLDSPTSGREAERLARVTHRSAVRALGELAMVGVLKLTTTPGTHLYQINRDHDLVPPLEALFKAEAARLSSLRDEVRNALRTLNLEQRISSVTVFGSAARGDTRPDSDLDLLVLLEHYSDATAAQEILGVLSDRLRTRYGARPSVLVLSASTARQRYEEGDPLLQNIATDGRTLIGTPIQEILGTW